MIHGPTYEEMRDPSRLPPELRRRALAAQREAPLDPVNLFNITWRDEAGRIRALLLPEALTGVAAPIVLLYAKDLPTGSHKVGATYSVLMERQLAGDVFPGESTLVWPSTGNGLKDIRGAMRSVGPPSRIIPSLDAVRKALETA